MDRRIEVRKGSRGNYEIDYFEGRKGKSVYHNLLNPNALQLAVILLDLESVTGLPIYQAVKIYWEKREMKDWLGL